MASFFQPGLQDPVLDECESSSPYQIYCNSILPSTLKFGSLYQLVILVLGATCVIVPLVLYFIHRLYERRFFYLLSRRGSSNTNSKPLSNTSARHPVPSAKGVQFAKHHGSLVPQLTPSLLQRPSTPSFRSTKSFCLLSDSETSTIQEPVLSYDLVIIPVTMGDGPGSAAADSYSINSHRSVLNDIPAKMTLAHIKMEEFGHEDSQLTEAAQSLALLQTLNDWAGFALECTSAGRTDQTNYLLACLASLEVPVILQCHHDCEAIDQVDLSLASGVIIENACILSNGQRRDYFKARRLRDTMVRCSVQRDKRPDFFVGFLDRWGTRPKPSVVRRAAKVAQHFDAVMEHGSAMNPKAYPLESATKTLSGFEYLRRAEMIEVQKCWTSGERKIDVSNASENPNVLKLSLDILGSIIPEAPKLLEHFDESSNTASMWDECQALDSLSTSSKRMPPRTNVWDYGNGNIQLSSRGCFPLTCEPTADHFDAVVRTQAHLQTLDMLQDLEGVDKQRLLKSLQHLIDHEGQHASMKSMIQELVDGLLGREIQVFKGLKTGFQIPRADVSFWGVSKDKQVAQGHVTDIYISLSSPCDTAVVLHTWLAHKGVRRETRFEEELQLERQHPGQAGARVPTTIRESIQGATYAELLSLSHKIGITHTNDTMLGATQALCRAMLIGETTRAAWNRSSALAALDDSLSMRQLLEQRLGYLVEQGAKRLPSLDNLCHLHKLTQVLADEAFLSGDKRVLRQLTECLQSCLKPQQGDPAMDVNADLFSLIAFTVLRRAAFEDVYMETTDRCPLFLSQPDQAAVFSELWILGSQCEIYFDLFPRDIGNIIYNRYRLFLAADPPPADYRRGNEIMTMYPTSDEAPPDSKDSTDPVKLTTHERMQLWKKRFAEAGAMSIFCLPAIVDVTMLTFLGRGCFMTAFMDSDHLAVAGYALLASMLLTAGVTGWVGSVGHFYMAHYAYDNMIYFHVQRLSGGFVITLAIALCGLIGFSIQRSVSAGFVFVAYVVCIATYFNVLGVMSTMHLHEAPLASGRKVILQTLPILLLSPIISTFVNGHDLEIYLPVMYVFLGILLLRYRRLCQQWSGWMENIPKLMEKDVLEWFSMRIVDESSQESEKTTDNNMARIAFTAAVDACIRRTSESNTSAFMSDALVRRVSEGMPYIEWLLKKTAGGKAPPPKFTTAWFTQLTEAISQQQQLRRGLKEHSSFILFRHARHDIGQNLGLFLIALMDRWIMMVMSARQPYPSIYTDSRSRYGIWLAIVYFCLSAMILDATLQKYWSHRYEVSNEKMSGLEDAERIEREAERRRRESLMQAITDVFSKLTVVFGCTTILLWLLVESTETMIIYLMYVFGYSSAILFQFNRCFTTNTGAHVTAMMISAAVGFVVGCLLHAIPGTAGFLYTDVLSQNLAAFLAALGTSYFAWRDETKADVLASLNDEDEVQNIITRSKLNAEGVDEMVVTANVISNLIVNYTIQQGNGSGVSDQLEKLLQLTSQDPNHHASTVEWSDSLIRRAMNMWQTQQAVVTISTSESFYDNGLDKISSLSYTRSGVLHVVIGLLGGTDSMLPAWQPTVSVIACEALLHHVARSEMNLSQLQAVQSEHFVHGTDSMSKRYQLELASQDHDSSRRLLLQMEVRMMELLCLDLDVNSGWSDLPQFVREMILDRVCGSEHSMSAAGSQWVTNQGIDIRNIDFHLGLTLGIHKQCEEISRRPVGAPSARGKSPAFAELRTTSPTSPQKQHSVRASIRWLSLTSSSIVKWMAILSGGGSNIERELSYLLGETPLKSLLLWFIQLVWRACRYMANLWIYWFIIHHKPALVNIARLAKKGERRKIKLNRGAVVVDQPRETLTGFASHGDESYMTLTFHKGLLKERPQGQSPAFFATYDQHSRLQTRVEQGHSRTATYTYAEHTMSRQPVIVEATKNGVLTFGYYDQYGRISRGTISSNSENIGFQYHYRLRPKGNADLLRADYTPTGSSSGNSMSVFWGKPVDPERYDWVPSKFVHRIVQRVDGKMYITEYDYQHRRDPVVISYMQGDDGSKTAIAKRPQLFEAEEQLLVRPENLSFESEDVLYHYSITQVKQLRRKASNAPTWSTYLNPMFWFAQWNRRVYKRVPTWRVRTELWNHWKSNNSLDASTACWVDEVILREEPSLRKYWQARDSGRLEKARQALDDNINQIVSAIDMQTDVAEVTLLAIKTSDLYAMGLGNDANPITTQPQSCYNDTDSRISVIFNDIGCWPISPGGVSNCRRDLVNGHSTIRNHVLAECANDFGIPRFQVEKNVQSMKLLPLWGLDGNTANHGVIDNLLESQVDDKIAATDIQDDVVATFVPLLTEFVKGARTKRYSRADLVKYSNVILSMGKFFETKDYSTTWKSSQFQRAWMKAWLIPYNDPNIASVAECFEMERPSMSDFRDALGIYMAYLFIYAVQVPEDCPRVFQSTHHGISSLYGMILQCKQDVTFGIWDHAIYWRETCLNISPAQCELPLSVQSMLLAGISLASRLAYFHADVIMPCASVFNPMWEIEMGTDGGAIGSKNMFKRKVDPIVNGISNMDRFTPAEKVRTDKPTVVMLSNVQFIKGVKIAIQAADVIINQLGFKDYQLVVYGAKDRQPSYCIEMEKLIVECGLSGKVVLAGFGDPKVVLQDAWLFMNSSMSEGLPLAIGEAALAGVPIVATEVGATALVLTDPKNTDQQYGEVVPPNDPMALARAQLSILGMVGPWSKFTGDDHEKPPVLPDEILPEHVGWLTRRFYEKADGRRKLGLLSREVVLQSFHGSRYLREHEQMYWIQWYMSKMRKEADLDEGCFKFGTPRPLRYADHSMG